MAEGTIFSDVIECRNALATFSIKTQSEFKIDKSEPGRLTVHCAYTRCKWRMHASLMRNSRLFQVLTRGNNNTNCMLFVVWDLVVSAHTTVEFLCSFVCLTCLLIVIAGES